MSRDLFTPITVILYTFKILPIIFVQSRFFQRLLYTKVAEKCNFQSCCSYFHVQLFLHVYLIKNILDQSINPIVQAKKLGRLNSPILDQQSRKNPIVYQANAYITFGFGAALHRSAKSNNSLLGVIHKPCGQLNGDGDFSQMTILIHKPYLVKVAAKGGRGT